MNIEDAAAARDEGDIDLEILLQFRGQTGRFRKVVSHLAVFDGDFHDLSSDDSPIDYLVMGRWRCILEPSL